MDDYDHFAEGDFRQFSCVCHSSQATILLLNKQIIVNVLRNEPEALQ